MQHTIPHTDQPRIRATNKNRQLLQNSHPEQSLERWDQYATEIFTTTTTMPVVNDRDAHRLSYLLPIFASFFVEINDLVT
jgi:hypothetical protein